LTKSNSGENNYCAHTDIVHNSYKRKTPL